MTPELETLIAAKDEAIREAFEVWVKSEKKWDLTLHNGRYWQSYVQHAWDSYAAASKARDEGASAILDCLWFLEYMSGKTDKPREFAFSLDSEIAARLLKRHKQALATLRKMRGE